MWAVVRLGAGRCATIYIYIRCLLRIEAELESVVGPVSNGRASGVAFESLPGPCIPLIKHWLLFPGPGRVAVHHLLHMV